MTQTRNGVVLSILAIERTKVWEQKMWADALSKPSTGESYNAKSGEEWIVFRIRIKSKSNRVSYKHLELTDATANTYKPLLLEIFWEAPEGEALDVVNEIPFGVPAGTRIKSLRIEDFSFDLESIVPLSMGSVLQQKGTDKPGTPQVYKGTEISVVSLEKTKEYKDVFGRKLTAKPGFDILVVKLKFKMAASELKFDMCRLNGELESTGKGYTVMSSPGDEVTYDITFALPEGTPLNTFQLDDLTFDIKKFDSHKRSATPMTPGASSSSS